MSVEQDNTNKQMKRLIIIISSLLVISVILLYNLGIFQLPQTQVDGFEAVPQNTAGILVFKDYKTSSAKLAQMEYAPTISKLKLIQKFQTEMGLINGLSHAIGVQNSLTNTRLLTSIHSGNAKQLDFLYIFDNFSTKISLEDLLTNTSIGSIKKDQRASYDIFEVTITPTETLYLSFQKGVLLVSKHIFLIEYAIEQLNDATSSIKTQADFSRTMDYTGNNGDLAVFLNLKNIGIALSSFGNHEKSASIEALQSIATWVGLDILFQNKNFIINGYTHPDLDNKLLTQLSKQELPDDNLIGDILPDNTAIITYIGVKNTQQFYRDLRIEKTKDFQDYIRPWIGQEVAYVVTEPRGQNFDDDKFAVFHTTDPELAAASLDRFGEKVGKLEVENYQNYTIKRIMMTDVLKSIFGKNLNLIHNPYYTIIDNHVVFCNSKLALRSWIDKYFFGQTLGRDANYLQFKAGLSSTSNVYLYFNTSSLLQPMYAYTTDDLKNEVKEAFSALELLAPIGIQLTANNDKFFTNALVNYSKSGRQVSSILWRSNLDTNAAIAPKIVINHRTQEKEIFIQDHLHNVYLLNRNGEQLWKKQLNETIISDIFQVDYYGNGFLQFMFNTPTKIYALDRNGKSIEGFPRNITPAASNGMLVVDYLQNQNYRYFYATTDGNIHGFDKEGTPLEGWNPKENVGIIHFPIQHFIYNELDYIAALNTEGKLHLFKRNGEIRLDSVHFAGKEFLSTFGYDTYRFSRMVATDSKGKAYVTNFSGKTFRLGMNIGNNKKVQFEFVDLVGDERKDYAVLSEKELGVFYYEGASFGRFYKHTFPEPQDTFFPIKTQDISKYKLGTISKAKRRIYLLDENGFLFPDFPLAGTTPFKVTDLYDDEKNVLVAANGSVVYSYKLKDIP